ncbi:MAG: DUF1801 domain-containing protein, partial [Candidatus Limnocylindrales bacterium]
LADYPPPIGQIGHRLREIVRRASPNAIERVRTGWRIVGYDLPVGRRTVYFCWIMPEPKHIHLGFVQGVAMDDPDGILRGDGVTKLARWVTLRPGDVPDASSLTSLVQEAARVAAMPRAERMLRRLEHESRLETIVETDDD